MGSSALRTDSQGDGEGLGMLQAHPVTFVEVGDVIFIKK